MLSVRDREIIAAGVVAGVTRVPSTDLATAAYHSVAARQGSKPPLPAQVLLQPRLQPPPPAHQPAVALHGTSSQTRLK